MCSSIPFIYLLAKMPSIKSKIMLKNQTVSNHLNIILIDFFSILKCYLVIILELLIIHP